MRTTRLNEYDLTRIVRRVLNEQHEFAKSLVRGLPNFKDSVNKNNTNPCFDKATIKLPGSCTVKPLGGVMGTGFKVGKDCLRDLGGMMSMKNLSEVTKLMACLIKQSEYPIRYRGGI